MQSKRRIGKKKKYQNFEIENNRKKCRNEMYLMYVRNFKHKQHSNTKRKHSHSNYIQNQIHSKFSKAHILIHTYGIQLRKCEESERKK